MAREMIVALKCPYCDMKFKKHVPYGFGENKVSSLVLCDASDGGCDGEFVVKTSVDVNKEIYFIPDEPVED